MQGSVRLNALDTLKTQSEISFFFYFSPSLLNPAYYEVPWEKFYSIHSNQQFKDGHDLNRKKLNMKVCAQQGDPVSGCGKQAILIWSHLSSGCSSDFKIATRTIFSVSKGDSVQTAVVIKNCSDFGFFQQTNQLPLQRDWGGLKLLLSLADLRILGRELLYIHVFYNIKRKLNDSLNIPF